MEEAFKHCHKHLGDNVTILYDNHVPESMKKMVEVAGGAWECYEQTKFVGWEFDKVVAVTTGQGYGYGMHILELITRARIHLSVILVRDDDDYASTKKYFQQAANLGLIDMVEMVQPSAEAVEISQGDHEADVYEGEEEIEDETVEEVDDKAKEKISCMSGCCTS